MIYWKEECKKLAAAQAKVAVVDSYDENGVPVFVVRAVWQSTGSRSGKNSYWSVVLSEPLSDDCIGVSYSHILAINDGEKIVCGRLTQYHPAWTLSEEGEQELVERKYKAMVAIGHNPADAGFVSFYRLSREECEVLKQEYLNGI